MASSNNNNNTSSNNNDTPLLQRSQITNSFLHQNILVGVVTNPQQQQQGAGCADVVSINGRLDAVDSFCNVTLGNASSKALLGSDTEVSKVASIKGANVAFFGIPKKN